MYKINFITQIGNLILIKYLRCTPKTQYSSRFEQIPIHTNFPIWFRFTDLFDIRQTNVREKKNKNLLDRPYPHTGPRART